MSPSANLLSPNADEIYPNVNLVRTIANEEVINESAEFKGKEGNLKKYF
jgi:hypothetical protein